MSNSNQLYNMLIASVDLIELFLAEECSFETETKWTDHSGFGFKTDFGYFYEGLDGLKAYLFARASREAAAASEETAER